MDCPANICSETGTLGHCHNSVHTDPCSQQDTARTKSLFSTFWSLYLVTRIKSHFLNLIFNNLFVILNRLLLWCRLQPPRPNTGKFAWARWARPVHFVYLGRQCWVTGRRHHQLPGTLPILWTGPAVAATAALSTSRLKLRAGIIVQHGFRYV